MLLEDGEPVLESQFVGVQDDAIAVPMALPSIRLGRLLNLPRPSNSALFELLDDRS